jgi:hypothetical protein
MPMTLGNRLSDLTSSFSARVLDAIRGASLEELLSDSAGRAHRGSARSALASLPVAPPAAGASRRRSGRLSRRSAGDIARAIDRIAGLLKDNPKGLRAEEIRQRLGLQAKELPRPIKEGLEAGRFAKAGQKRATTYFARGVGGAGAAPRGRRRAKTRASRKRA